MFDVMDFSDWNEYDGFAEGSGRSEKIWLISGSGQIGLFKYPKIDPEDGKETTEHVSEHLAHQLGELIGIPTAKVDIGHRNGRIGSMSYLVRQEDEALCEGISFISGKYPKFNAETMQDEDSKLYYCIDHIFQAVPDVVPKEIWIEMMLFDYLIGNADRHQSNWGLLAKVSTDQREIRLRRCPLYDNGSSLCCYVNESQLAAYGGKDFTRFNALVDSKSKSIIRIDGATKKRPTHSDVVRYLLSQYPDVVLKTASNFIRILTPDVVNALIEQYPDSILGKEKKRLIYRFICRKMELLDQISARKDCLNVNK